MRRIAMITALAIFVGSSMVSCSGFGEDADKVSGSLFHKNDSAEPKTEKSDEPETEPVTEIVQETTEVAAVKGMVYIDSGDAEYIKLYEEKNTTSAALLRLYTGDSVDVYDSENGWYYVTCDGIDGYVEGAYITDKKPEKVTEAPATDPPAQPETSPAPDEYDTEVADPDVYNGYEVYSETRNAYCSADDEYIYSSADLDGAVTEARKLYYGDPVTVYGEYDGFYYISTESGSGYDIYGYMPVEAITIGTPPIDFNMSYTATQGYVSSGSANLRSTPSKENNDNVIATLHQGEEFTILSFDGYWYYISYSGGTGYLSYKMVEVW